MDGSGTDDEPSFMQDDEPKTDDEQNTDKDAVTDDEDANSSLRKKSNVSDVENEGMNETDNEGLNDTKEENEGNDSGAGDSSNPNVNAPGNASDEEDEDEVKIAEEEDAQYTMDQAILLQQQKGFKKSSNLSSSFDLSPEKGQFNSNADKYLKELKEKMEEKKHLQEEIRKFEKKIAQRLFEKRNAGKRPGSLNSVKQDLEQENDLNEKYMKDVFEHKTTREHFEAFQISNKKEIEENMEKKKKIQAQADELIMTFLEMKIQQAREAESFQTGKPIPISWIEKLEKNEREKIEKIRKLRTQYLKSKSQKSELEERITEKDSFSEGLSLIDFEQLKMEKETHNERIEEKNESLAKSEEKAKKSVHILTHMREKFHFVENEKNEMDHILNAIEREVKDNKDILTTFKKLRDQFKEKNRKMKDDLPLAESDTLLWDFENRKKEKVFLSTKLEELKKIHTETADAAAVLREKVKNLEQSQQILSAFGEHYV